MIRDFIEEDTEIVLSLGKELNKNFNIGTNDLEKTIVYVENGEVLGFLSYSLLYGVLDLTNIIVNKSRRNRGIGKMLLNYIKNLDDVERVMLEVRESNKNAIDFYRNNGFKNLRTIKDYYSNGEDAIVMEAVIR